MRERQFQQAIFAVIEHITKAELTNQGMKLVINYFNESGAVHPVDKAREAIIRYTQEPLPSLEQIREKSSQTELDDLDHLVLKMEYMGNRQ